MTALADRIPSELRGAARAHPLGTDWAHAFADSHEVGPLSRREALKHLG